MSDEGPHQDDAAGQPPARPQGASTAAPEPDHLADNLEHDRAERAGGLPPADTAAASVGIAYNDRVLVLGFTGAGKSALLDHLFGVFRCQRLLCDTKGHEFDVYGPDGRVIAPVFGDVAAIDWQQPIIHYVDTSGTVREYGELFERCFRRRRLIVRADELADVCEYHPNKAPLGFRKYCAKGRAHGLGLLAASQRPVLIPSSARTEAQHVFVFGPRLDPDDHNAIAKTLGQSDAELGRLIDALPDFGFLWWDKAARRLQQCSPLPDHLRADSIVRRRTVA